MPDKLTDVTDNKVGKITDTEIKKALECWIKNYDGSYANFKTLGSALDLINRLQAENERLETENKCYAELEQGCYVSGYKKIKSETYKECIEKVKENLSNIAKIDWQGNYYYLVGLAFFDNLLKEMGVDTDV